MASFPVQLSLVPLIPHPRAFPVETILGLEEFGLLHRSGAAAEWLTPVSPVLPTSEAPTGDPMPHLSEAEVAAAIDASVVIDLSVRSVESLTDEEDAAVSSLALSDVSTHSGRRREVEVGGCIEPPTVAVGSPPAADRRPSPPTTPRSYLSAPSAEHLAGRMRSTTGLGALLFAHTEAFLPVSMSPDESVALGVALREPTLDSRAGLLPTTTFSPRRIRFAIDVVTLETLCMSVCASDPTLVYVRRLAPTAEPGGFRDTIMFFRRPTHPLGEVTCLLHHTVVAATAGGSIATVDPAAAAAAAAAATEAAAATGEWLPSPPHSAAGAVAAAAAPLRRLVSRLAGTHAVGVAPAATAALSPVAPNALRMVYMCTPGSDVTTLRLRLVAAATFSPTAVRAAVGDEVGRTGSPLGGGGTAAWGGASGSAHTPAAAASGAAARGAAAAAAGTDLSLTTRRGAPRKRRRLDLATVDDARKRRRIERNREAATRANKRRQAVKAAARAAKAAAARGAVEGGVDSPRRPTLDDGGCGGERGWEVEGPLRRGNEQ